MDNKNNGYTPDNDKWGYAVCFGTVITFIAGIGHCNSFGLLYKDFIQETNSSAKSLTSSHGVFAIMLAAGGITLNIIAKRSSLKLGGLLGALILCIGSFTTILIPSTNWLPITFGILQGTGMGMMVPVCYSTLNRYFVKKRTTVMSICKAVQGIILMWYPQLIKYIHMMYGFRGSLLIVFGISLHCFPGMIVMRDEAVSEKKSRKICTANAVDKGEQEPEQIDLLSTDKIRSLNDESKNKNHGRKLRREFMDLLNVKVLNDRVYCNICLGQSFVNFSDLTFFVFQPMLLFQYGFDTSQVATCISIGAGADVAGRCALAAISSCIHVNTRLLFYISTLLTLIFRIVLLQTRHLVWVGALTGALGVLRAWLHVSSPLVVSAHVSHGDFPAAYALFMLAAGIVNVTFAPLVGLLKDVYEDYVPAFYALSACCLPCLVCWPLEYLYTRSRK